MNIKSWLCMVGALCFGAFLFGGVSAYVLNAQNASTTPLPVFTPPTFSFQNNLSIGSNNQDVRELQVVLNSDQTTRVADTGVGSKGQESTYFGHLTADAVMRFQQKYQLLTPTGIVGPATRKKLNQLISTSTASLSAIASGSPASNISLGSTPEPLAKQLLPRLYALQPVQVKKGQAFTLIGDGFEADNTVHIGSAVFAHVMPQDSNNISFTIPMTTALQNGSYEVWVENSNGTSRVVDQPVDLVVADVPLPSPIIISVSPATIATSGTVTVTGSGFSQSGNSIVSGFGTLKGLSSNGTAITFSPRSLLSSDVVAKIPAGQTIKVDFYVVNDAGSSNIPGSVNLQF